MLPTIEKIIFVLLALGAIAAALRAADRIRRVIARGKGRPSLDRLPQRAAQAAAQAASFAPTWRVRLVPSLLHAFVGWAFIFYLLVNLGDVLQAFLPGFVFLGNGVFGGVYRLIADLISVAALIGLSALLLRRFVGRTP